MTLTQNTALDAAVAVRRQRLSGHLHEALQKASRTLSTTPGDWTTMGEAIRTLICLGEADAAAGLYQSFTGAPGLNNNLEPEALVRLALLMDRRELLGGMEPPAGPTWLVSLLVNGVDPIEPLTVADLQLRIEFGHSVFTFVGNCPHCNHGLTQVFKDTLLVYRTWTCPGCFGQVTLDYAAARTALTEKFSTQIEAGLQDTDRRLIEHIKPKVLGTAPAPPVVQALGQGYHFMLNELVLKYAATTHGESGVGVKS